MRQVNFIIYGRPHCSYCESAKKLLNRKKLDWIYYDIEYPPYMSEFKEHFPDAKTVPQIMTSDGDKIGGYTELEEWLKPSTNE